MAPLKTSKSILVLMGVSGSGKTTVGRRLSERLGWPYYDGDDFHPRENVAKMAKGEPLTDLDREPWLQALADLLEKVLSNGGHAVLAASLLKRAYREKVIGTRPEIQLIFLSAPFDLLEQRLRARPAHFFKAGLLDSQFEILEAPEASENALVVAAGRAGADAPLERLVGEILSAVEIPGH